MPYFAAGELRRMYVDLEGEFPPFRDSMAVLAGTGTNSWPSFLQTRTLVASTATRANSVKRAVRAGLHCGQPNPPLALQRHFVKRSHGARRLRRFTTKSAGRVTTPATAFRRCYAEAA